MLLLAGLSSNLSWQLQSGSNNHPLLVSLGVSLCLSHTYFRLPFCSATLCIPWPPFCKHDPDFRVDINHSQPARPSNHVYESSLLCEFPRCFPSSYRHPTSLFGNIHNRQHTFDLAARPVSCHNRVESTIHINIYQSRTNPRFNDSSRSSGGRSPPIRNAALHISHISSAITSFPCSSITARLRR